MLTHPPHIKKALDFMRKTRFLIVKAIPGSYVGVKTEALRCNGELYIVCSF